MMERIIYGYHAIEEMLNKVKGNARLLFSRVNERGSRIISLAERKGIPVERVSEEELDRRCEHQKHRGVLLTIKDIPSGLKDIEKLIVELRDKQDAIVLLLDGITDPHNYGAILRSADQFGVDFVISPERRSAHETGTVNVTSAGASAYVNKVVVPNLMYAVRLLKKGGFWIYGTDTDGRHADSVELTGKIGLVLGSEGKGMRRLVRQACDVIISIPGRGNVDSLNVSVAAGILLYECRRQQGFEKR
jgi:23S rRNA (guanosine2251-2'-O)-methyltransferase